MIIKTFFFFHLKAAKQREDELQTKVKVAEANLEKESSERLALERQHQVATLIPLYMFNITTLVIIF